MSATLSRGQKVKVRYFDSHNLSVVWDGVIEEKADNGWRVQVGSVSFVFSADDIEVIDEQEVKADAGPLTD